MALLSGKPLVAYAIEVALASKIFGRICVSSEDTKILDIANLYGPDIAMPRPKKLATDKARVPEVCRYILAELHRQKETYKEFAVLLPTSPLRTVQDIQNAYSLLKKRNANYVMSLIAETHPPQLATCISKGYIRPYFGKHFIKQSQDLEQLYRHDGTIIFAKTNAFLRESDFYGSQIVPYIIDRERSVDIDTPFDLKFAEFLMKQVIN